MKDLQHFYLRVASALERPWTSRKNKRDAALLVRNHAIETPHCLFCGEGGDDVDLHTSGYTPKTRICKLCAIAIAEQFGASTAASAADGAEIAQQPDACTTCSDDGDNTTKLPM